VGRKKGHSSRREQGNRGRRVTSDSRFCLSIVIGEGNLTVNKKERFVLSATLKSNVTGLISNITVTGVEQSKTRYLTGRKESIVVRVKN